MAKTAIIEVSGLGRAVWDQYKRSGDFALFMPNNPDSDDSGMFHVKLADWEIVDEQFSDKTPAASVTARLRHIGVDEQGRTA